MTQKGQRKDEKRIQEGFPHQRLTVVPASVHTRCHALPMVSQLHITHIGTFPSAPHHYVERKGVPQAILIYCLEGKGWLKLNETYHTIEPGHVLIIPPDIAHTYGADRRNPWSVFWIHFDGQQTHLVLESLGVNVEAPCLYVPDVELIRQRFEDTYSCLNYHYSDAGLLAMTSELMRLLSQIKLNSRSRHQQQQAREDRIRETIHFMEQHLDMSLTLENLATRAGHSVPHYCKKFKKVTNQAPMTYFLQLKIRKACDLLYRTDQTIREIAHQLGYHDPYYFSRLFKKIQGCSPTHYRNSIKSS